MKSKYLGCCIILGAFVLAILIIFAANARDLDGRYAASPLKDWFEGLRSPGFGPCCSDADGAVVNDVDWGMQDGGYRVRLNGEWINVPPYAVVTVPNLYGRAMVWPMTGTVNPETHTLESFKGVTIRCFMPGPMA